MYYARAWLLRVSGSFHFKGFKGSDSTCCLNSLPYGVVKQDIHQTAIKLLNDSKSATMGSGTKEPMATTIISANFTIIDNEK